MYGTRAEHFGIMTGGFDVYVSSDLNDWSDPIKCFDSEKCNLNKAANWAPEVHKYNGKYYMFATFTQENGLRGTYILKADSPLGPFAPHSNGPVTPEAWECLDGTLYISTEQKPYLRGPRIHVDILVGIKRFMDSKFYLAQNKCETVVVAKLFKGGSRVCDMAIRGLLHINEYLCGANLPFGIGIVPTCSVMLRIYHYK